MGSNQDLSKQALPLLIARGISFLLTLGIPLVLVRHLDQAEFGAYKQSILICTTAITLLPWGMSQSLYYFIPIEPENRAGYLANSFLFLICAGALSLLLSIFAGPTFQRYFHSAELAACAPIIGLYIFFSIGSIFAEVALISEGRVRAAAAIILYTESAKAAALIGGVLLTRSFAGIIIAITIAAGLRFLLVAAYFSKDIRLLRSGPDFALWKKQLKYSLPFGMSVLIVFIQNYFHQYYISYSFTPAEFAIYAVGCLQLPVIDLFYSSIGDVAMVKITGQLRENNIEAARIVWHETVKKLAVLFFPLAIFMLAVSQSFIIALFTENYRASVPIFQIILLEMFTAPLFVDPMMRVFGETSFLLWVTAFRLPLTIFTVIAALAMFGMTGAAASTIALVSLVRLVLLVRTKKLMEANFSSLLPWRNLFLIFCSALGAALPVFIVLLLPISSKAVLFIATPLYGVAYLMIGLKLNIFSTEDRQMFRNYISKIAGRLWPSMDESLVKK